MLFTIQSNAVNITFDLAPNLAAMLLIAITGVTLLAIVRGAFLRLAEIRAR